ncbi:MAG: hypothetical protein ACOYEV_00080 [Candidatus Nanopelagicales bacterium]
MSPRRPTALPAVSAVTSQARRAAARLRPGGTPPTAAAPGVFDSDYYLASNPDVAAAGVDPWTHYLHHGRQEGRAARAVTAPKLTPVPRRVAGTPGQRVTAYTSINFYYLDRALVLADSIRLHHPDWHIVCVLVEPSLPPDLAAASAAFDEVILVSSLFGKDFSAWMFGLNVVEACTAVKGQAMVELLSRGDADKVLYIDPDIWLLRPMSGVLAALDSAAAVLTPHVLAPATTPEAIWDGEVGSLKHGIYNLGFAGARDCPEGRALARWWADRLRLACWDAPGEGIFTDQKWMNLAPIFFPGVEVLRDPGLNVASWNLNSRAVTHDEQGYYANGSPLTFFHFTKAETVGPAMTALHAADSAAVARLWREYLEALHTRRSGLPARPAWGYGRFLTGEPVTDDLRLAYRADRANEVRIPDPLGHPAQVSALAPPRRRWQLR